MRHAEDGSGPLPTFGLESPEVRLARIQDVRLDSGTSDADIRPEAGTLFRVRGRVQCTRADAATVAVVLSSETGRRNCQSMCNGTYAFDGLAPSLYEIFAVKQDALNPETSNFRSTAATPRVQ